MSETTKVKKAPTQQVGTSAVLCGGDKKERPRCGCRGNPARGYMCGMVTVGGEYCHSEEPCDHKITQPHNNIYTPKVPYKTGIGAKDDMNNSEFGRKLTDWQNRQLNDYLDSFSDGDDLEQYKADNLNGKIKEWLDKDGSGAIIEAISEATAEQNEPEIALAAFSATLDDDSPEALQAAGAAFCIWIRNYMADQLDAQIELDYQKEMRQ